MRRVGPDEGLPRRGQPFATFGTPARRSTRHPSDPPPSLGDIDAEPEALVALPSGGDQFARALPGGPLLHVDADAFFAAVEQRDDPSLRGIPMAAGDIVIACAGYEAREWGVQAGMSVTDAVAVCPRLRVVPLRPDAYAAASAALFAVFGRFAARVEPGSMEEAFLDTRATPWATADQLAAKVQRAVWQEVGLPVTVGAGRTKLMAKLASRSVKPRGLRVIQPAEERYLRPALLVDELWGVGEVTRERLRLHNIRTVADIGLVHPEHLRDIAGTLMARRLAAIAAGSDDATVRPERLRRSFSVQRVLPRGTSVDVDGLADELAGRLGEAGLTCAAVGVGLLYATGLEHRGRLRLAEPTADAERLAAAIRSLLPATGTRVEKAGITVTGLQPAGAAVQLTLDTEGADDTTEPAI
ncbi:DNA polymerase IV [Jiangella aurantiaca]|uniref:DNA polymerase IV n=1 Tax=Jiangella aurantiaca TaxID=2530373 RepID=A0A4R5A4S2_9ACTN|nr:DNA polymerase IV [Jiangella aurantiaca]TDD66933.1 DNA polymerase IV [Jiangella aurantiaca]